MDENEKLFEQLNFYSSLIQQHKEKCAIQQPVATSLKRNVVLKRVSTPNCITNAQNAPEPENTISASIVTDFTRNQSLEKTQSGHLRNIRNKGALPGKLVTNAQCSNNTNSEQKRNYVTVACSADKFKRYIDINKDTPAMVLTKHFLESAFQCEKQAICVSKIKEPPASVTASVSKVTSASRHPHPHALPSPAKTTPTFKRHLNNVSCSKFKFVRSNTSLKSTEVNVSAELNGITSDLDKSPPNHIFKFKKESQAHTSTKNSRWEMKESRLKDSRTSVGAHSHPDRLRSEGASHCFSIAPKHFVAKHKLVRRRNSRTAYEHFKSSGLGKEQQHVLLRSRYTLVNPNVCSPPQSQLLQKKHKLIKNAISIANTNILKIQQSASRVRGEGATGLDVSRHRLVRHRERAANTAKPSPSASHTSSRLGDTAKPSPSASHTSSPPVRPHSKYKSIKANFKWISQKRNSSVSTPANSWTGPRQSRELLRSRRTKFSIVKSSRAAKGSRWNEGKSGYSSTKSRQSNTDVTGRASGQLVSLRGQPYSTRTRKLMRIGAFRTSTGGVARGSGTASLYKLDRRQQLLRTPSYKLDRRKQLLRTPSYKLDRRKQLLRTPRYKLDRRQQLLKTARHSTATQACARAAVARSVATMMRHNFSKDNRQRAPDKYCLYYNRFGRCSRGASCPFIHDPSRIALCSRFLRGKCVDEKCPFSHKMSKSKMPVCSYFLKGRCTRAQCPYLHVNVGSGAELCLHFLSGFCPAGDQCKKKHTLVCPAFEKNGSCPNGTKCMLRHVKSGTKRMYSKTNSPTNSSSADPSEPKRKKRRVVVEETGRSRSSVHALPSYIALSPDAAYPVPALHSNQDAEKALRIRPLFSQNDDC